MDFVFTAFIENLRVYIFYRRLDHRKKVIVQKFERSVPKGPPTPLNPVEIHALEPVAPIPLSGPTMKRSGVNGRNERAHALKYFILLPFWKGMKEREREWEAHVRGPMSERHPTSASEGWHERSRLTVRGVQITPLSPPSVFPSSFCPKELGSPPSSSRRGNTFRLYGWRRPYMFSISRVFMSLYIRENLVKGGTPLFSSDGLKSFATIEITCVSCAISWW